MVKHMRDSTLNNSQQSELWQWLRKHNINPAHRRREFTDVLPVARLLRQYYPELIDVNYYPPRNSFELKMNNWELFHKRVLSKLGVRMTRGEMEQVSRSTVGPIDELLFRIMKLDKCQKLLGVGFSAGGIASATTSVAASIGASANARAVVVKGQDVKASVPGKRTKPDAFEMRDGDANSRLTAGAIAYSATLPRKIIRTKSFRKPLFVTPTMIRRAMEELSKRKVRIGRALQKVAHLENMLILKSERIDELQNEINRIMAKRMKVPTIPDPHAVLLSVANSVQSISNMHSANEPLEAKPLALGSLLPKKQKSHSTFTRRSDRKSSKQRRHLTN